MTNVPFTPAEEVFANFTASAIKQTRKNLNFVNFEIMEQQGGITAEAELGTSTTTTTTPLSATTTAVAMASTTTTTANIATEETNTTTSIPANTTATTKTSTPAIKTTEMSTSTTTKETVTITKTTKTTTTVMEVAPSITNSESQTKNVLEALLCKRAASNSNEENLIPTAKRPKQTKDKHIPTMPVYCRVRPCSGESFVE
eukprot:Pgem_evm1s4425